MDQNTYKNIERLESSPMRVWVNQPSTLQPLHKHHGNSAIAVPPVIYGKNGQFVRIYFTEGSVISMNAPVTSLNLGTFNKQEARNDD